MKFRSMYLSERLKVEGLRGWYTLHVRKTRGATTGIICVVDNSNG